MLKIQVDPGAADNAFAAMLTDLMQANVQQHPKRADDFAALNGSVAVEARDAEVAVTLDFRRGEAAVHDGVHGKPDVRIATDSSTVLELSSAKLRLGLPDLADASGRAVVKKMLSGDLKISGLGFLLKPMLLIRFTKLLSVSLDAEFGLHADEQVRCRTGLHWLVFVWPALAALAAVGAWLADWRLAAVGLGGGAIALWLIQGARRAGAEFTLTNERLLLKPGLCKKKAVVAPLADVASFAVKRPIGGAGTIAVRLANGTTASFCGVARAREFGDQWKAAPRP